MATISGGLGNKKARPIDFNLLLKAKGKPVAQDPVVPVDITFVAKLICGKR